MQLQELTEYAGRRGFQIVEEYVDHGSSGSKESRPALDRLMNDARRRKFDAVLVWKIDRFGRSLRHLVNSLAELESLGVAFIVDNRPRRLTHYTFPADASVLLSYIFWEDCHESAHRFSLYI